MTQLSDTPTSQSTAGRWTLYRRLGLLMRTRLDDEGTTLSLHDVAARTNGRVSVDQLSQLFVVAQDGQETHDPVTYVLLAQAFDIDPDFFVTDEAVAEYIAGIRDEYASLGSVDTGVSLQQQAYALATRGEAVEVMGAR